MSSFFDKRCPHCNVKVKVSNPKMSKVSPSMCVCEICGGNFKVKNPIYWHIVNALGFIVFAIWLDRPEDDMATLFWMPIVSIMIWILAYKYLVTLTSEIHISFWGKIKFWFKDIFTGRKQNLTENKVQLDRVFNKSKLDDEEQLSKASFFVANGCANILMWQKSFKEEQVYFLINFVRKYCSCADNVDAAYFISKCMASLHDTTTIMDFLHTSKFISNLGKDYKKYAIENLIIFTLLEDKQYSERLNYVGYIYEDLGLGGRFGYQRLLGESYQKSLAIKECKLDQSYTPALDILEDALSRTNYC